MEKLLSRISKCNTCETTLALGPRPVLTAHTDSKILIIGQAPGTAVHNSGIPWDDKSGDNLRAWMNIDKDIFYCAEKISIMPMGFCYPGKGKSGDLPPEKKCAPQWHGTVLQKMTKLQIILLVGKYAQDYYLPDKQYQTLTETVRNFTDFMPNYFVLPHPSPRNNIWQAKNPWFAQDIVPALQSTIKRVLES